MKTVRLMTCNSPIEANIIKGRLENENIDCFVTNQNFATLMPHYNNILGAGAQIMIFEQDYEKATKLLKLECKNEIICPNCGSNNINIRLGKNRFKKIFIIFFGILGGIPFNNVKCINYCKECKSEFK